MLKRPMFPAIVLAALLPVVAGAVDAPVGPREIDSDGPRVVLRTNLGEITIALDADRTPRTVENFLQYAEEGFYNGTVFHRVIENMLIQGGAYTPDLRLKPTRAPIPNEAEHANPNLRGTIAAARAPRDAHSASSQFFINVVDNLRFDFRSADDDYSHGYTVFGRVVSGMDVVDRIRAVETGERAPLTSDVPVQSVVIERVDILPPSATADTAG